MQVIPLSSAPAQRFTVILEGKTITIFVRYEALRDGWVMSLEHEGEMLLSGQRLVMGTDMLRSHNFDIGGFFCAAVENPGVPPGRNDFGDRVTLVHITEAERAAVSP